MNFSLTLCLLNGKKSVFIPNVHQEVGRHGLRWLKKKRERSALRNLFGIGIMNTLAKKMDVYIKLGKLIKNLYNAYLEKFGEEKIWCTYSLTIEDDYSFHVDLGYEMPEGNLVEQHDEVYRNFFNKEYVYLKEKYPY